MNQYDKNSSRFTIVPFKDHKNLKHLMVEYAQSWRKKLKIKQLIDIAKEELGEDYDDDIKKIQEKLDSEMKTRWKLIKKYQKRLS